VTGSPGGTVRVVVADDSTTARRLLVALCESDPGIRVVGEAADGAQAVELTRRLRPSLVLMDVQMPVMDGVEATKEIMRAEPTPIIMVTGGTQPRDVEAGLSAIRFGALTVLPKPPGPGAAGHHVGSQRLVTMVKALADVKVIRRRASAAVLPRPVGATTVDVVGVAASTGGPPAVCRLLQHLPPDLPVPVVVVQHIVEGFLPGLAAWLRSEVPFPVGVAGHGERLEPGAVYLAPDGAHLEVDGRLRAALSDADPVGGFRPSATVLFRSLARGLGPRAVGVVLTGMGRDGLEGARELRGAGGRVLAQDEATSVVFGMPGAVAQAGVAHLVAPVEELAADLTATLRRRPS
jgi:two-component system chemotaxis response regulator CheB